MKYQALIVLTGCLLIGVITCSRKTVPAYEISKFSKEQALPNREGNQISLNISYPQFQSTDPFWDQVNLTILKAVNKDMLDQSMHSDFEAFWNHFVSEFSKESEDFPEGLFGWALDRSVEVLYLSNRLLSLRFTEYQYTGGAHPNTTTHFLNYDVKNEKPLSLENLFLKNSGDELKALAETEFRKAKGIPEDASLNEQGYFFENDHFRLSTEFAIEKSGVLFYYNQYDIAPYAAGPAELLLTYEALKPIIDSKGALRSMVK